jgi:dTDP-glucose 4,6-dehydratase
MAKCPGTVFARDKGGLKMRLLVTGGAGFIGTNFVYRMLADHPDIEIVCLDALTYAGCIQNLDRAKADKRFRFVKGDISKREVVFPTMEKEGIDAVVNFAAESHVDRSIEDPGIFLVSNVLGTQVLMDACRKFDVERFHQISTDEVYGDLPLDRSDLLFTEETPIRPSSPYSASKASADLLVQAYHRTYGLKTTISRCSNNYGPYQFPEKLIPKTIMLARAGKKIPIYGTGRNVRDWIHVDDHCVAIDRILSSGTAGRIYNIGGRSERTNLQVVGSILRELGKPEDSIEFVRDRAGHDMRYAIDSSRMENELGWKPRHDFEKGLKQTVAWYNENEAWLLGVLARLSG